jgi:hypothetical protein
MGCIRTQKTALCRNVDMEECAPHRTPFSPLTHVQQTRFFRTAPTTDTPSYIHQPLDMLPANLCSIDEAFGVMSETSEQQGSDAHHTAFPAFLSTTSVGKRRNKSRPQTKRSSKHHHPKHRPGTVHRDPRQNPQPPVRHVPHTPLDESFETQPTNEQQPEQHAVPPKEITPVRCTSGTLGQDTTMPVTQMEAADDLHNVWRVSGVDGDSEDGGWAQAVAAHAASRQSPSSRYQAQFAKAPDADRIPTGVEVSLSATAAPFDKSGDTENPDEHHPQYDALDGDRGPMHVPTGAASDPVTNMGTMMTRNRKRRATPAVPVSTVASTTAAAAVDVHDELEWMRNNISHLGDQIEQLTTAVQQDTAGLRQSANRTATHTSLSDQNSWTTRLCDNMLYLMTGLFVLIVLDIVYRAGCRNSAAPAV